MLPVGCEPIACRRRNGHVKRLRILAAFATLLALAACSGDETGSTTTAEPAEPAATITITDFSFTGATSVAVGETVTVTNEDTVGHTWTSTDGQFDSGSLAEGATFEYAFDEAGSYDFFCSVHPDMTGTITAEG